MCLFGLDERSALLREREAGASIAELRARGAAFHWLKATANLRVFGRFGAALLAPTEFVWVVDDDVRAAGPRFLELLLHVAGSRLRFGALGASGWLMPPPHHDLARPLPGEARTWAHTRKTRKFHTLSPPSLSCPVLSCRALSLPILRPFLSRFVPILSNSECFWIEVSSVCPFILP